MEENRKILPFTDDEGNTVELEIVDSFEMDDKKYAILVEPETDEADDEGLVYIMEIQSDSDEEMILIEIEEDEVLERAYAMFRERCEDEFDFVD